MLSRFKSNFNKIFGYSNLKIQIDKQKRTVHLTLTKKEKRNPLSYQTLKQIQDALVEIQQKSKPDRINMMILRGEGSVFSAGHDLIQLKNTKNPEKIFNQCTKTMLRLKNMGLITLCAVDNSVTAAGLQLALTCDLIIASESASFGIPGMKRGLFPSTPLVQLERSLKSPCLARQICLIGQMLTAQQAYKIGIINKVLPTSTHLQKQVEKFIDKAQNLSSQVIMLGKKALNKQIKTISLQQAYQIATKAMVENLLQKNDSKEGLSAFAVKRSPIIKK